ncbi:MAG TPA: ACT domain-containing protein [Candidatus Limnocylindrales bacterium]|jgi:hypothetical protein|nr:ACT domain-containing protein [Candidatus Limnocylindrales bacterium]
MAKDLTVYLEDRPGTLAEVGEALGGAGINIDGACGFPSDGRGVMHVLVADASAAREALQSAGLECGDEREVEVVMVVDQPGELGRHLRRIADARVNVNLLYLTTGGQLVLGSDDPKALHDAISG